MDALRERLQTIDLHHQSSVESQEAASPLDAPQTPLSGRWRNAADKSRSMGDPWAEFHIEDRCKEERARRHRFNALKCKWTVDDILVKMEEKPFAHGAMRNCFRMKKLSNFAHEDWNHAANYVAKSYIKRQPKDTYFDDVQLQMDAKLWGNEFNKVNPPKKVDIIQTYIIEMVDRPDKPVLCVEHLIEGNYIKYNSNSGFVSDTQRRTPQAFSHFTFEHSAHHLIVVDVQGVGDLYTDPQIHTSAGCEYGEANLGLKGMALFFATHKCNPICRMLDLKPFELSTREVKECEKLAQSAMSTLTKVPTMLNSRATDAALTRRKLLDKEDIDALSVVRSADSLPPSVRVIVSVDDVKAMKMPVEPEACPETPPPTAQLSVKNVARVSSRSSSDEDSWKSLQNSKYRDEFNILGQVHMEFALYHEIGRFNPAGEPNVIDALFHVDCAARCGHRQALKTIAQIYLQLPHDTLPGVTAEETPEHHRQGLRCLYQASECGDRECMVMLARRLDTGDGLLPESLCQDDLDASLCKRSHALAVQWYSKAVTRGDDDPDCVPTMGPDTNYSLLARQAEILREGNHGIERDVEKAAELYGQAAEAATAAMKGKMASKYYILAEECAYE
ncbi:eukaryotic elongation factor 2 kinase-like [Sycon ciliatum]|uniref:eukaryotic elongation factor 2 kinase-like n=1 Tax=Sycon ciliatum TaxID=27933 RepID=UPI0031F64DEC